MTILAVCVLPAVWAFTPAKAEFLGMEVELFASDVSHSGPGGSFDHHDIWRLYATFTPGEDIFVSGWGNIPGGASAVIHNVTADGAPGSGFFASQFQPGVLPMPLIPSYYIDPTAADLSTFLTMTVTPGYTPVEKATWTYDLVVDPPGVAAPVDEATVIRLNAMVTVNLVDGALFYGAPDENGRLLLGQFNVAHGEHVEGGLFLHIYGEDVPPIHGFFSTIPAPTTLAALGLAWVAGRHRRR